MIIWLQSPYLEHIHLCVQIYKLSSPKQWEENWQRRFRWGRREGVANKAEGLPKSCKWRKRNKTQRIDEENEWLITVHPTQLKMKHTGTRHQRGTYCIGTSWQQWQNSVITNRKLGTFPSLLAALDWMYSGREAVIPLSLPVPFLSHAEWEDVPPVLAWKWLWENQDSELVGFLCLMPAGPNLLPIKASAFPHPWLRWQVCCGLTTGHV